MHLYQAGMPLALLTEWLGHADPETTLIYAHADTEMKRHALEKANSATTQSPLPVPLWHDREDIQRLCGLKECSYSSLKERAGVKRGFGLRFRVGRGVCRAC